MTFFRSITIEAAEVARNPDAIRGMRREEIDGIILRGVYDADACARVCARLETGQHGLVRTEFPAPFRSHFLGVNLNLAPDDLTGYFAAAAAFHTHLAALIDLETRVATLLGMMDAGRRYRAAPGPDGQDHMFTTLRAHLPGGFIPQHFDNEQAHRPSYRHITPHINADLYSFVLAFSRADAGGALQIFNLQHGGRKFRMADGADDASRLDVTRVESVSFRLRPGEMILFNSGRYLHRVTPVIGTTTRWTACSFMSESHHGETWCWG